MQREERCEVARRSLKQHMSSPIRCNRIESAMLKVDEAATDAPRTALDHESRKQWREEHAPKILTANPRRWDESRKQRPYSNPRNDQSHSLPSLVAYLRSVSPI